jgi:hypothetical protein
VAVTKPQHTGAAILAAALALPGVCPEDARAESAPEHSVFGLRYLNYQDWQPGLRRITASSPSMYALVPFAGSWSVQAQATSDVVSGASPRSHTTISSASVMHDTRTGADLKVTKYWNRVSLTLGGAYSTEHDYESRSLSALVRLSSDDNNRTWAFGLGGSNDRINPVNHIVTNESKKTTDFLIGVTQVLTPNDIAQVNLTYAGGRGYYNDPYKIPDNRPRERNQLAVLTRWNHYLTDFNATLKLAYRYYSDSFKVRAHTVTAEWAQAIQGGWTVTPLFRYHTQSAAFFYYDPVDAHDSIPANYNPSNPNQYLSADQRLSAFGAVSVGLKVAKQFEKDWVADARLEYYYQRGDLHFLGGNGSPDLAPFSARFIEVGLQKKF